MPSPNGSARVDLHHLLSYRLSVVSNQLSRSQLKRFAAISDISLPEWRMLVLVDTYGPLSVRSLSRHAGLDFAQASRVVSRMCEAGSIVKQPASDARSVNLVLTAAGQALQRRLWKVAMRCNDEFLGSLSDAERAALFTALDTLAGTARQSAGAEHAASRKGRAAFQEKRTRAFLPTQLSRSS